MFCEPSPLMSCRLPASEASACASEPQLPVELSQDAAPVNLIPPEAFPAKSMTPLKVLPSLL